MSGEVGVVADKPADRHRVPGSPWKPWMRDVLADWQRRWPAAFRRPVPLAVGFSRQIREALSADGALYEKRIGLVMHIWTQDETYLRALVRGVERRNLVGTPAGVPDEAARAEAQRVLDERAARRAERQRLKAEQQAAS